MWGMTKLEHGDNDIAIAIATHARNLSTEYQLNKIEIACLTLSAGYLGLKDVDGFYGIGKQLFLDPDVDVSDMFNTLYGDAMAGYFDQRAIELFQKLPRTLAQG